MNLDTVEPKVNVCVCNLQFIQSWVRLYNV